MTLIGLIDRGESAQLAGGYGLMLAGSAVYLLAGLGLRRTLMSRSARSAAASRPSPISSHVTANQA